VQTVFVELDSVTVAFTEHGQILATESGFITRIFTEFEEAERRLRYGSQLEAAGFFHYNTHHKMLAMAGIFSFIDF
jgi:hypothetical protein